jgi:diguanylate cyclase (GGDEF)-like protein
MTPGKNRFPVECRPPAKYHRPDLELFLYQLSIWGLAATSLMIAIFFVVLKRSNRREEMRWWTAGWFANVAAMAVTLIFWYEQPDARWHGPFFAVYLVCKNVYVWLLLRGTLEFQSWRPRWIEARYVVPLIAAFSILALFIVDTRDRLGLVSQAIVAIAFIGGAWSLSRANQPAARWIVIALSGRALLGLAEAAAYGVNVIGLTADQELASAFLVPANWIRAAHYPFDTAAEWLVAMGFLIGVSVRAQHELQLANAQMLSAQADLRRLADRDPLTSLVNRRALPEVFRDVHAGGATLVFFDLDGFKQINDKHGHQTGDECLVRFANALSSSFRPTDAIFRYAGDEFLVIAKGTTAIAIEDRITELRQRLRSQQVGGLPIRFSHGVSVLEPGGNPEDALRAADEAMYRSKPHTGARKIMVADWQSSSTD